jgi:hypothetical protein
VIAPRKVSKKIPFRSRLRNIAVLFPTEQNQKVGSPICARGRKRSRFCGLSFPRTKTMRRFSAAIILADGVRRPLRTWLSNVRLLPVIFDHADWPPAISTSRRSRATTSLTSKISTRSPLCPTPGNSSTAGRHATGAQGAPIPRPGRLHFSFRQIRRMLIARRPAVPAARPFRL